MISSVKLLPLSGSLDYMAANIDSDNIESSTTQEIHSWPRRKYALCWQSNTGVGLGLIRSHLALECVAGWAGVWGGGQSSALSPVQAAEHTGTNNPPHPHVPLATDKSEAASPETLALEVVTASFPGC